MYFINLAFNAYHVVLIVIAVFLRPRETTNSLYDGVNLYTRPQDYARGVCEFCIFLNAIMLFVLELADMYTSGLLAYFGGFQFLGHEVRC